MLYSNLEGDFWVWDGFCLSDTRVNTNPTDYIGGLHVEDGTASFLQTSEGRVVIGVGAYTYEYNLTDHLGNVHVVVDQAGAVSQTSDYYPFGLLWKDAPTGNTPANEYLFNGKEYTTALDLDWMDFGARLYDPALGRWHVIDPLADKMRRHSPYNYAFDNPIRFIDRDGMEPVDIKENRNKAEQEEVLLLIGSFSAIGAYIKKGILNR